MHVCVTRAGAGEEGGSDGGREDEPLIQHGWSGWSLARPVGRGRMGRHRVWGGERGAQEVTRGRVHSKQADQREPGGDRHCGRETLPAPTGDTGVHFLWNVSGIAGNRPTSNPPSSGLRTAGAPLLGSNTPSRKKKKKKITRGRVCGGEMLVSQIRPR